jgi:hypothetical protein
MTKEVVVFALSLVVGAIAIYGLRFFKPSKEMDEGFTDAKGEGIYMGYTDKARPDIYVRPRMRGGFWGDKYTPIWLSRKRKEEEEDPEKDKRRE